MAELVFRFFDRRFWGSFIAGVGILFAYFIRDQLEPWPRFAAVVAMTVIVFAVHYWKILSPDEKFQTVYGPSMDFLCELILQNAKSDWEDGVGKETNTLFPIRVFVFRRRCSFWLVPVHKWNVPATHADSHIEFFGWRKRPGLVGLVEARRVAAFTAKDNQRLLEYSQANGDAVVSIEECFMTEALERKTNHVVAIACIPLQTDKKGGEVYLCIDAVDHSAIPTLWQTYCVLTSLEKGSKPVLQQMAMYNS